MRITTSVLSVFTATIFLSACVVDVDDPFTEKTGEGANAVFRMESADGAVWKPFLVSGGTIHVAVPNGADLTVLTPVFTEGTITAVNGEEARADCASFDFSDFLSPLSFTVLENLESKTYKVILYDLPVLTIDTPNKQEITSKIEQLKGCELKLTVYIQTGKSISSCQREFYFCSKKEAI